MPFGAGVFGRGSQCGAEEILREERGDDGMDEEGAQLLDRRVGFGDDEIDVACIAGAAAIGAPDDDFHFLVCFGGSVADDGAYGLDFGARDASEEVVVVGDAYFLVVGQMAVRQEVGEGLVALADPFEGL